MHPDDQPTPTQPADLPARLEAAGVVDEATLQAALTADPQLAADFAAFLQANPELLAEQEMNALLQAFAQVPDSEAMQEFWRKVPSELEADFVTAVETLMAQAEAGGDNATVEHLRPRLAAFKQIQQAAQAAAATPPVVRALRAFVLADDENQARTLFAKQRTLLQPYEAQRILDKQLTSDDPAVQQRIHNRRSLLRQLRGVAPLATPPDNAAPTPTASFDNRQMQLGGDLYQVGGDQYLFAAHAEGQGAATVVNNLFVQNLERRWTRPQVKALDRDVVARPDEMTKIKAELHSRGAAVVTGKAQTVALQGAAGVGKTTLTHQLALELGQSQAYPDGVIWEELGPGFVHPDQAQAVLRRWVGYATNFFELGDNLQKLFRFEPEAVRSLLAEHGRLLVVLDNVWSQQAIQPLRAALPPGVHLLLTTRLRQLARNLGVGFVEIGLLQPAEAVALFALRLQWQPQTDEASHAWAFALMKKIDYHALGLDVALGVLLRYGDQPQEWRPIAEELMAAIVSGGVEALNLGEDDPGHNVKAVVMYSYRALTATEQRRLRSLGAFAAESEFSTEAAAALWQCALREGRESLTNLSNAALLERRGHGRWRQHGLLRAFALALLQEAGEAEAMAAAHARGYAAAIRAADDEQRYHELLLALPQLRHAFAWAVANDLELALEIAGGCYHLQQQFGLIREGAEWAEQMLAVAHVRADPATMGRVLGQRANLLSDLASLPGEDRRQRLSDALAAYDDALRFRRPDNAPYSKAHSNWRRRWLPRKPNCLAPRSRLRL